MHSLSGARCFPVPEEVPWAPVCQEVAAGRHWVVLLPTAVTVVTVVETVAVTVVVAVLVALCRLSQKRRPCWQPGKDPAGPRDCWR